MSTNCFCSPYCSVRFVAFFLLEIFDIFQFYDWRSCINSGKQQTNEPERNQSISINIFLAAYQTTVDPLTKYPQTNSFNKTRRSINVRLFKFHARNFTRIAEPCTKNNSRYEMLLKLPRRLCIFIMYIHIPSYKRKPSVVCVNIAHRMNRDVCRPKKTMRTERHRWIMCYSMR